MEVVRTYIWVNFIQNKKSPTPQKKKLPTPPKEKSDPTKKIQSKKQNNTYRNLIQFETSAADLQ